MGGFLIGSSEGFCGMEAGSGLRDVNTCGGGLDKGGLKMRRLGGTLLPSVVLCKVLKD